MGSLLARHWWAVALRGAIGHSPRFAIAILFGLAVLAFPGISSLGLIVLFGVFVLIGGIFALISLRNRHVDEPSWVLLFEGITGIVIGIATFIWPGLTGVVLLYFIASWAVVSGIFEIIAAIGLRRQIENEWLLILAGIASLIFGILLAIWPAAGALAILWLIGGYAIFFGILLLILGFRLRSWKRQEPPVI
jgi:uncharacterized membrane protein HdeD (DUF308 family)